MLTSWQVLLLSTRSLNEHITTLSDRSAASLPREVHFNPSCILHIYLVPHNLLIPFSEGLLCARHCVKCESGRGPPLSGCLPLRRQTSAEQHA